MQTSEGSGRGFPTERDWSEQRKDEVGAPLRVPGAQHRRSGECKGGGQGKGGL